MATRTHSVWRHRHWHASAFTGISTIWPPPQPVCEHGSGSHPGLSLQVPGFRRQMNEGWYQIRLPVMTRHRRRCTPVFTNSWGGNGHPYCAATGRGRKGWTAIVLGAAAIVGSFFTAGASMAYGVQPWQPVVFLPPRCCFHWSQHDSGRCGPDAGPEGKNTDYRATDNGRQNTYFSSLDNILPRGTRCRCLTGKCWLAPADIPGHQHP